MSIQTFPQTPVIAIHGIKCLVEFQVDKTLTETTVEAVNFADDKLTITCDGGILNIVGKPESYQEGVYLVHGDFNAGYTPNIQRGNSLRITSEGKVSIDGESIAAEQLLPIDVTPREAVHPSWSPFSKKKQNFTTDAPELAKVIIRTRGASVNSRRCVDVRGVIDGDLVAIVVEDESVELTGAQNVDAAMSDATSVTLHDVTGFVNLDMSGASNAAVLGTSEERVRVRASDASKATISISGEACNVNVHTSGTSKVFMNGDVNDVTAITTGSTHFSFSGTCKDTVAVAGGSSQIHISLALGSVGADADDSAQIHIGR